MALNDVVLISVLQKWEFILLTWIKGMAVGLQTM